MIHPDTIPLTAFGTPTGLYEWLRMPEGAAGAPGWFVSVMRLVATGLDHVRIHLDDAIGSDACPINHVSTFNHLFRATPTSQAQALTGQIPNRDCPC